jgi:hypothetical protein
MKLNQFERSISFIYNNLPGYLRKLYEQFIRLEGELYAQLKKARETNPYSVNEYVKKIIDTRSPQFIQILKYIMSEENQMAIQEALLYLNGDGFYNNYSQDDNELETILGGDLNAPVVEIKGFLSSFPYSEYKGLPIICIEPSVSNAYCSISGASSGYSPENRFWNCDILNETGDISLFNKLAGTLKIDIDHVLTFFFRVLFQISIGNGDKSELSGWDLYEKFHTDLEGGNEDFNNEKDLVITQYTRRVTGSAIFTYMTYAGRLLGAKENIYNWLYTTFVKETVSDIESGEYQKSADVTAFSGHQTASNYENKPAYVELNFINKSEIDRQKMIQKNIPNNNVEWNTNMLYKHIRLNYSNWCTVINAIDKIGGDRRNNFIFHNHFDNLTDMTNHLSVAKKILCEYISHYYATYNVYLFPSVEKTGLSDVGYFIKFISNRIFDTEIKDIINGSYINKFNNECECPPEKMPHHIHSIKDLFIEPDDVLGIMNSIKLVRNTLANLFMTYTYVIMLNGLYNNQDSILDEKDALTGRPKKDLFLEIYEGLITKIKDFFYNDRRWMHKEIVVYSGSNVDLEQWYNGVYGNFNAYLKQLYSPLASYIFTKDVDIMESISLIRDILKNVKTLMTFENGHDERMSDSAKEKKCTSLITDLYDIHPISVIAELNNFFKETCSSLNIKHDGIINNTPSSSYTRSGFLFPRNRITNDMIIKTKLYEPKLFTSLEAASELFEKAKEDSILANNGNYSFVGGIGGSVTDEEDTVDKFNGTMLPRDSTVEFGSKEGTNTLDGQNLKNLKINNLVDSWNECFKICVLGGKDIKIPEA